MLVHRNQPRPTCFYQLSAICILPHSHSCVHVNTKVCHGKRGTVFLKIGSRASNPIKTNRNARIKQAEHILQAESNTAATAKAAEQVYVWEEEKSLYECIYFMCFDQ